MDTERIELAVWEVLVNNSKEDHTFVPNRDIPRTIAVALAEYDRQKNEFPND